jgi:uncharacterized protein
MSGHEGEGLGGTLVRSVIEAADAMGKTVIATCPFAAAYIDRHPELDRFLAPYARRRPGGWSVGCSCRSPLPM